MNFPVLLLLISYKFFSQADDPQGQEISEISKVYESCSENGTVCYGDSENCIEENSCVYITNFIETEDDFQIQFWDRCDHNGTQDFLFAVGVATYDETGRVDCSQPLEMKHFKLFTLWNPVKCPVESEKQFSNTSKIEEFKITKENWNSMCEARKKETVSLAEEPLNFLLRLYLQKHIYYSVSFGRWKNSKPHYKFAESHKYFTKDGIFYLTNYTDVANLFRNSSQNSKQYFLNGFFGWIVLLLICLTNLRNN